MIRRLSLMLSIAVTIALFATTSRVFLPPHSQAVANPHAHVMVIVEENHAYSSIIGQSAAPYINSLASTYALATNSYASTHDSLGNYLGLISGSIQGVPYGTDTTPHCYPCSAPTLADELTHQGTSWKAYMESMPATCDTTLGSSGNYAARHNPFVYFSGVTTTPAECNSVVPFTTVTDRDRPQQQRRARLRVDDPEPRRRHAQRHAFRRATRGSRARWPRCWLRPGTRTTAW